MKSIERVQHWQDFLSSSSFSPSTQDSKSQPREEILQAKGKMYELHKQKLKKNFESEQMLLSPFRPSINTNSETKEKWSLIRVENRLIQYGKTLNSKLEQKRKEKMQFEEPSKSQNYVTTTNVAERLLNKKQAYDKKIEAKQIEKFETQSKLLKSPEICEKSKEIVKKLNRPENVETRLMNSAKQHEEKIEAMKMIQNINNKLNSTPQITPLAKKIHRHEDISERLTRYKFYYQEHLNELNAKYSFNQVKSKSQSNSAARQRILKPKSPTVHEIPFTFKPSLSSHSMKIAEKLEKSSSRLLRTPSPLSTPTEELNCFFKPFIS